MNIEGAVCPDQGQEGSDYGKTPEKQGNFTSVKNVSINICFLIIHFIEKCFLKSAFAHLDWKMMLRLSGL